MRLFEVSRHDPLKCLRAEQEPALGAIRLALVEQTPRPREPAAGLSLVPRLIEDGEGQPESATCRAHAIAFREERLMRTRETIDEGGVLADEVR